MYFESMFDGSFAMISVSVTISIESYQLQFCFDILFIHSVGIISFLGGWTGLDYSIHC